VLWGWVGDPLSAEELAGVDRVLAGLDGELGRDLRQLLSVPEIAALAARCTRLRSSARFPVPEGKSSTVPWPLFWRIETTMVPSRNVEHL
jgi:hypothetical protein